MAETKVTTSLLSGKHLQSQAYYVATCKRFNGLSRRGLRYARCQFERYLCAMPTVRTKGAVRTRDSRFDGFSLVEVLVVVMVILIIAAIAIPNLVHGKMRANEAAAVSSVKTINTAELMYSGSYPEVGFSSSL